MSKQALEARPNPGAGFGVLRDTRDVHVLIVDEQQPVRRLLAEALSRDGYLVSQCASSDDALEILRTDGAHVLVTDVGAANRYGLELCRAARHSQPEIGIVLMTSMGSQELAVEAMRQGADDFLAKPFCLDDLRSSVRRVAQLRQGHRSARIAQTRVMEEAASLRARSLRAERDLAQVQNELAHSKKDLDRRCRDLDFMRKFTALLSRETDADRILETTVRILYERFGAMVARIEVDMGDGVRTSEWVEDRAALAVLNTVSGDLIQSAQASTDRVVVDAVLGHHSPLETMATPVQLGTKIIGSLVLLRAPRASDDREGDRFLFSLVPQALGVALGADVQRRSAQFSAVRIAEGMLNALETRGTLYRGHAKRVAKVAMAISTQLGLPPKTRRLVGLAARLHDVGKVSLPDGVINRAGPLTEAELRVLRMHPVVGARILAPFSEAAIFVRHHCERPDGLGYPDGLRGDDIPLGAGIVGLAGAYNAIINPRPYKSSRSRREAIAEIQSMRGSQFLDAAVDGLLATPRDQL